MAKETNAVDTEKYAGPGTLFAGLTGLFAGGFVASIPLGMYEALRGFRSYAVPAVVMTAVAIVGGVLGYKKAARGQEQFNELKSDRDVARGRAETAESSLQKVSNAMQQTQERFNHINRMVREREVGGAGSHPKSYAEKHESRGEHGSHAAAVMAEKDAAKHAELTH